MNDIQVFNSPEFGEIRTVEIDNEVWFVGKDVASALGYSNTADAIGKHVDTEDKLTSQIAMAGQMRSAVIINESGLYSLILSSKLSSAKRFKHWVTSEVLPAIRKRSTPYFMEYSKTNEYGTFRIFMERSKTIQNKHERYKTTQLKGTTRNTTVLCECSHLEKLQKRLQLLVQRCINSHQL